MDTLPLSATDNGDGTATLKVDTELTATIDPTGLATSAKQDTGNSSLSSIDGKLPTLVGGKIPVDASVSIDSIDIGDVDIKEFPAGNLGQQAKAASLSVAPATDITDATYIGDIKFGESLPSGTALLGKVSIDQVTANANEIVVKSITAGPLPDTSASDLSHIHSDADSIKTAVEVLDNCISGNEAQVDVVTLPVSFNAGTNDATTQRVTLSTETLTALENITSAVDQTTDGTTNRVVAKISQVAGENHVEVCDSSGSGITSTGNALDINIKSGNPTTLPDTSASDLAHIHAKVDNLNVGDQAKAASISVTPATDITDGRYIGNVKVDSSALPTGAATAANQTTGNASLSSIDGKLGASTITDENLTLTVADTEYSFAIPANCKSIEFWSRNGYPLRYSLTATGRVATPTGDYLTLKSNCSYASPFTLNLSSKTIYFATDNAGDVVEILAWS